MKKLNIKKIGDGHIHDTLLLEKDKDKVVIQKLNKAFGLMPDITAITKFLDGKFPTIQIQKDWRVVNYIDAEEIQEPNIKQFTSAVKLVAKFHKIIQKFDAPVRKDIHSFPQLKKEYAKLPKLPLRVLHGDMRFDNILFKRNKAVTIIDLDTVCKDVILWDIANMIFMWCGGITGEPNFSKIETLKLLYFSNATFLTKQEKNAINDFVKMFALEVHWRMKDYKYFKKLKKSYCDMRSRNALKFYESFNKWCF